MSRTRYAAQTAIRVLATRDVIRGFCSGLGAYVSRQDCCGSIRLCHGTEVTHSFPVLYPDRDGVTGTRHG